MKKILSSKNGSTVIVKSDKIEISFLWKEEGCCMEADPSFNDEDETLLVACESCGNKKISLHRTEVNRS